MVMNVILSRKSVRKYTSQRIESRDSNGSLFTHVQRNCGIVHNSQKVKETQMSTNDE